MKQLQRLFIEVGFIMVLFYTNLLMGEFERSGPGYKIGVLQATLHIFTVVNFLIALIVGCFAFVVVEYIRKRFTDQDI